MKKEKITHQGFFFGFAPFDSLYCVNHLDVKDDLDILLLCNIENNFSRELLFILYSGLMVVDI